METTFSSAEAEASFREGLRLADVGRFREARAPMRAAVAADPDSALAHLGAALTSSSVEEFAEHLEHAAERAESAGPAERAWIASVRLGFENDLQGQLAEAERLTELAAAAPRAWLQLAAAHTALAQHAEARAAAERAIEIAPGFVAAHVQLGNSYLFNEPRDFRRAEKQMRRVVELEPEEPYSYDLLGDVYRAQGSLEKARQAYTEAIELDPQNGSPYQQRGHVNSFLGAWDEARADYQRAIELAEPDVAAAYGVWKALVSVHAGDRAAAVDELVTLADSVDSLALEAPRTAKINALVAAAQIAAHEGMTERAMTIIERCHDLMLEQAEQVGTTKFKRQQKAQAIYLEGMAAALAGDRDAATARAYSFMETLEPDANPRKNEPAHEILGIAALEAGDLEAAIDHLLQTDPGNVYARYHLGWTARSAGDEKGETKRAQAIFEEIAEHNFNFAGYALIRDDVRARAGS